MSLLDELASEPWAPTWFRRRAVGWLGYRVLHQALLPGGSLRVLERGSIRRLRFGDAWEDQSAIDLAAPTFPLLPYTELATIGLALPPRLDAVLHLGLGGGSLTRTVHAAAPLAVQHAVEPYAAVVDVARRYFELPDPVRITVGDAASSIEQLTGPYDLVFLDAFSPLGTPVSQGEATFARVHRLLHPEGWLVINATDDVRTLVLALHRVFASVAWINLDDTDQYVLMASDAAHLTGVRGRASAIGVRLGQDLEPLVDSLVWAGGVEGGGVAGGLRSGGSVLLGRGT